MKIRTILFLASSFVLSLSNAYAFDLSISQPAQNSPVTGTQTTVRWSHNVTAVENWWLRVADGNNRVFHDSGRITSPGTTSATIFNLPADGSRVYGILGYKRGGTWTRNTFNFISAAGGGATTAQAQATVSPPAPAPQSNGSWSMTVSPPTLSNPIQIKLGANSSTSALADFDRVGCSGKAHVVRIPFDRDAKISMDSSNGPLKYPVWITGGNNVHIVGIEMIPIVQNGCGIGQAHQVRDPGNLNIHPRLPGGKAFRLEQRGATFIEGVEIDLRGHEADCFATRNDPSLSVAETKQKRNVSIVNSRCTGIEGLDKTKIGDGIHGDFFQNQGEDVGSFVVENVTIRTSSNGIVLHTWNRNYPSRLFKMRNVDFAWDLRYANDSRFETFGLAFTGRGDKVEFSNVWLNHGNGLNYGFMNGERVGAVERNGYITKAAGINAGVAPTGDFAPASRTGLQYNSPY